jgi:hypothetical protein
MDVHESALVHGGFRYLKLAALMVLVAVVAYVMHAPMGSPNGGTWLGYTLGGIGALLILWLAYFGIRKRRYQSGRGLLRGWLSAHVYLGLALIVIVTLHTGFQVGWNIHTLAYALMILVIASGIFGIYAYARYPSLAAESAAGMRLDEMLLAIAELDRECRQASLKLGQEINQEVLGSCQQTRVGGSAYRQLSGTDPNCATTHALETVRDLAAQISAEDAGDVRKVLTLLAKKVELLRQVRRVVQFRALWNIWLYFHIPLSFALLAALLAHIVSVFFYW